LLRFSKSFEEVSFFFLSSSFVLFRFSTSCSKALTCEPPVSCKRNKLSVGSARENVVDDQYLAGRLSRLLLAVVQETLGELRRERCEVDENNKEDNEGGPSLTLLAFLACFRLLSRSASNFTISAATP